MFTICRVSSLRKTPLRKGSYSSHDVLKNTDPEVNSVRSVSGDPNSVLLKVETLGFGYLDFMRHVFKSMKYSITATLHT